MKELPLDPGPQALALTPPNPGKSQHEAPACAPIIRCTTDGASSTLCCGAPEVGACHGRWCRVKAVARTAVVALLAMSVFWTAARLHAEPLLACMVAGVIVINRK